MKLDEANLLNREIKDLKYFISALDVTPLQRERSNVTSIIKKITTSKYMIFGRRFFGCGAHEQLIEVPTSMIPALVIQAKDLLKQKQIELENIFSH